jgi:hypothetical protein
MVWVPERKVLTRQPTGPFSLNLSHPFFDSGYWFVFCRDTFIESTGAINVVKLNRLNSRLSGEGFGATTRTGIAAKSSVDTSELCSMIQVGNNSQYHFCANSNTAVYYNCFVGPGAAQQGAGAGGSSGRRTLTWTASNDYVIAAAFKGFTNPPSWDVFVDGKIPSGKSATGTGSTYNAGSGTAWTAGYDSSGAGNVTTYGQLTAKTSAVLRPEILQSLSENPWQLFATRRTWIRKRGPDSTGSLRVPFTKSDGSTDNIYLDANNKLYFEKAGDNLDPIDAITV